MFTTPPEDRQRNKNWRDSNLDHSRKYSKDYYKNNEHNRIKNLNAVKVRHAILGLVIKDLNHLTGCTNKALRDHLESLFDDKMSWENYGKYGWHVDHKTPCKSYDLVKPSEVLKCFHYSNLQPLWADDNYKKKDKVSEQIKSVRCCAKITQSSRGVY